MPVCAWSYLEFSVCARAYLAPHKRKKRRKGAARDNGTTKPQTPAGGKKAQPHDMAGQPRTPAAFNHVRHGDRVTVEHAEAATPGSGLGLCLSAWRWYLDIHLHVYSGITSISGYIHRSISGYIHRPVSGYIDSSISGYIDRSIPRYIDSSISGYIYRHVLFRGIVQVCVWRPACSRSHAKAITV